jgi:carbamoyltransferase
MGLAPYGEPRFSKAILNQLIDLKDDGSFRMDMSYFNYCQGLTMTGPKFDALFEGPPRRAESPLTQREMDIAASIQAVTNEIMLRMARHVSQQTGLRNLVMAGGVALNCVANGLIAERRIFDRLWIQPAAGDAGGALGAALFVWHQLLDEPRVADGVHDRQQGSLLGPQYDDNWIRRSLDTLGAAYHYIGSEDQLLDLVADQIAAGRVIGYVDGRMEFGPRALGARSILGDARSATMQSTMNLKIKFRESFRPFAPCVLREHVHEWFTLPADQDSAYMLLIAPVHPDRRVPARGDASEGLRGIERLTRAVRSNVPAVTHVDHSARVQTVDERHGRFYRLLKRFHDKSGCPVMINTSFNIRGEPIVCTPEQAVTCFAGTGMDTLVLGSFILFKEEQAGPPAGVVDAYKDRFALD